MKLICVAVLLCFACAPNVPRTPTGVKLRLEQAPIASKQVGLWQYAVWTGEIVGVWMAARPQLSEPAVWRLVKEIEALLIGKAKFKATGTTADLRGVAYPHLPAIAVVTRDADGEFDLDLVGSLWKHEVSHVIACRLLGVCTDVASHKLFAEVGVP